jgi:hypothetical protein
MLPYRIRYRAGAPLETLDARDGEPQDGLQQRDKSYLFRCPKAARKSAVQRENGLGKLFRLTQRNCHA